MATNDDVLDVFRRMYIEFVNDDEMYPNFLAYTRTYKRENALDAAAQPKEIKEFIINSRAFESRLAAIIRHLYPAIAGDYNQVDDKNETYLIQKCVSTFKDSAEFSIGRLTDVLRSCVAEFVPSNIQTPVPNSDHETVHETNDSIVYDSQRNFIRAYEIAVKRPMYAYELLCFQHQPGLISDTHMGDVTSRLATNVSNLYRIVSGLVMRYAGKHISEHDFTNDWMEEVFLIDDDKLVDILTERLMSKDVYISGMKQRIRQKYQSLFDAPADDEDVKYIFARAAKRSMHLLDDALDGMLVDIRQERQEDFKQISSVYDETYGRVPDEEELRRHMYGFRDKSGCDGERNYTALKGALRIELCHDLEYQDTIKEMIQSRYAEVSGGKQISPRILYDVLRRVLGGVGNDIHDIEKLRGYIDANIQPQ